MKIIIFSDSLGRPRPDIHLSESTEYEDVYGYLLKEHYKALHDIEIIYIDSLDTSDAIFWSQRMVAFRRPDCVIFHLGLNDCVPRLFKKNSRSLLLNPFFRKVSFDLFLRFISRFRHFFTFIRRITYVSQKDFRKNLIKIKKEIELYNLECKFICILIAKSAKQNSRSCGYNKNIEKYNFIFSEIFQNTLDVNNVLVEDDFISDDIHLTKQGHIKIFNHLRNLIDRLK